MTCVVIGIICVNKVMAEIEQQRLFLKLNLIESGYLKVKPIVSNFGNVNLVTSAVSVMFKCV